MEASLRVQRLTSAAPMKGPFALDEEALARALARDEAALLGGVALSPVQLLLRMPPPIVFMANAAVHASGPPLKISQPESNRFARLQLHYAAARKELAPLAPAMRLFMLSPSMVTDPWLTLGGPWLTLEPPRAAEPRPEGVVVRSATASGASASEERALAEARSAQAECELLCEIEAERGGAAGRKARRKKPRAPARTAVDTGTVDMSARGNQSVQADASSAHLARTGDAEAKAEASDTDSDSTADGDVLKTAEGPSLEELMLARPAQMRAGDFDPSEWTEVAHPRRKREEGGSVQPQQPQTQQQPQRSGASPQSRDQTGAEGSVPVYAAPVSAAPVSAAPPSHEQAPSLPAAPLLKTPSEAPAPSETLLKEAPLKSTTAAPPLKVGTPSVLGSAGSSSGGGGELRMAPRQPLGATEPTPPPHRLPAARSAPVPRSVDFKSLVEQALGGDEGPAAALCAHGIAAAVGRYLKGALAHERTAHEFLLCRALKEAHERAEARTQSLRLRLYISETKCADLEATVRDLELQLVDR
ncbi:hypothetical protein T492DRAFT_926348 [Pavlovales sp. CCMP2436]|nr:hypothetical protein T492DRAFT_926348 [Pavlovales sp. CCMP2436]